jgi:hypothetical protein
MEEHYGNREIGDLVEIGDLGEIRDIRGIRYFGVKELAEGVAGEQGGGEGKNFL